MPFRARSLLRALRVLLACAILSVIALPTQAASPICADGIAWIDGARDRAAPETTRARSPIDARLRRDASRVRIMRRPSAARAFVVRSRIYLHHMSLLR